jgi:hypothetical protein
MKEYLKSIVSQLSNYSKSLNTTALFIDKPWAMIDDEFEIQKLIFKRDKELILSKNGIATIGKWDYLPAAKSLLIDRGKDKILCNEAFINEGVLILKVDGTSNNFFALANENIIPDLNIVKYLKGLKERHLKTKCYELVNGRELEINMMDDYRNEYDDIAVGLTAYVQGNQAPDGGYKMSDPKKFVYIKDGKIKTIITPKFYITRDGIKIEVHQKVSFTISLGDKVYLKGIAAPDGKYKLGFLSSIRVRNGVVY